MARTFTPGSIRVGLAYDEQARTHSVSLDGVKVVTFPGDQPHHAVDAAAELSRAIDQHAGRCWDGAGEDDACTRTATTVLSAAVWAPSSVAEFPALVPCCTEHAVEIELADDAAGRRAERLAGC